MALNYERECPWRIVFKDIEVWIDDEKYLLHVKRWDVGMRDKKALIKGGYYLEESGSDGKSCFGKM